MCGFKTLTLPSGLTKIGKEAFADCIRLKSLTLSPSLTSIGVEAFGGLGNLRTLTIPSGLTSIDSKIKSMITNACHTIRNDDACE